MSSEEKKQIITANLRSIERYNPENLDMMEEYVNLQAAENTYELEINLAVLKFYQFFPDQLKLPITHTILLKALTNLPHSDFTLCKYLLLPAQMNDSTVLEIIELVRVLEACDFSIFWERIEHKKPMVAHIKGFFDSIRKFICHVVGITFQTIERTYLCRLLGNIDELTLKSWLKKYGWIDEGNVIFIANQDENIKTKNITEKIEFENLAHLMANCL